MKPRFEAIPHKSFGPIKFGDGREQVRLITGDLGGALRSAGNRDVVDQLVVHYDNKNRVVFVESERSKLYTVVFGGDDVFASRFLELLSRVENGRGYIETEKDSTFVVPHLDVVFGVNATGISQRGEKASRRRPRPLEREGRATSKPS